MHTAKSFRTLRGLTVLLKLVAWAVLLLGVLVGSMMTGMGAVAGGSLREAVSDLASGTSTAGFTGLVGGVGVMFMSVVYFVLLLIAAEIVSVLLSVEQSSRETGRLVREMWATLRPAQKVVDLQAEKVEL